MQESYFKARDYNLEKDLFGDEKVHDGDESVNDLSPRKGESKMMKSKQALKQILEEDQKSVNSSNKLPRSKSGYIENKGHNISHPEVERQASANKAPISFEDVSF